MKKDHVTAMLNLLQSSNLYEIRNEENISSIEEALARVVNGCNWVTGS